MVHDRIAQSGPQLVPFLLHCLLRGLRAIRISFCHLPCAGQAAFQIFLQGREFQDLLHQCIHLGLIVRRQIGVAKAPLPGQSVDEFLHGPLHALQTWRPQDLGQILPLRRATLQAQSLKGLPQGFFLLPLRFLGLTDLLPE